MNLPRGISAPLYLALLLGVLAREARSAEPAQLPGPAQLPAPAQLPGPAQLLAPGKMDLTTGLVGHWPLQRDVRDLSGRENHGTAHHLTYDAGPNDAARNDAGPNDAGPNDAGPNDALPRAARFDGRRSFIEIPDAESLRLGQGDFTLAMLVKLPATMNSVFGDLASKFDPDRRRGVNLSIGGSSSAYNSMGDSRHVHFGIDDAHVGEWQDHGRPWPSNSLITCLTAHEGQLYAGIADAEHPQHAARVFRWAGEREWVDCGRLGEDENHLSVQSMIVHQGKLYAGTGIWDWDRARGQLPGKPPAAPPRVFVYEGGKSWRDLGQVGETSRVLCMASFGGELYVGLDRVNRSTSPGRCYKLSGSMWIDCGAPDRENFENLLPIGGTLYAATHGSVFEYLGGTSWKCIGDHPFGITQIHSLDVYQGRLHAGTWPQGYVLRYEGDDRWISTGRLGIPPGDPECNEINDLLVHNGKLYAGVIPKAELYRYDADDSWTLLKSLGRHPDWARGNVVSWCRVTAMATHQGRLFAGTGSCIGRAIDAPADASLGRVYSLQTGQMVSHEHDLGGEWTHLAAVRKGERLLLYINGKPRGEAVPSAGRSLDLSCDRPLLLGLGAQTHFTGHMADVRLYSRALDPAELERLGGGRK